MFIGGFKVFAFHRRFWCNNKDNCELCEMAFLKRKRGYYGLWFENILFKLTFWLDLIFDGVGIVDTDLEMGSI